MSKRNKSKKRHKMMKCRCKVISEERLMEIHAEAYYRALKRIDEQKVKEPLGEKEKDKHINKILFFLNFLVFPWKISKRFVINNHIYDNILSVVVSSVFGGLGCIMRLIGIVLVSCGIYQVVYYKILSTELIFIPIGFALLLWGSIFAIAGKEFAREKDSNKIYAYSASVLALISCILSLIALLKG